MCGAVVPLAAPHPLEQRGVFVRAHVEAAQPTASVILRSASNASIRQTCAEIDRPMAIAQEAGLAEVAAGYFPPDVAD